MLKPLKGMNTDLNNPFVPFGIEEVYTTEDMYRTAYTDKAFKN